MCVTLPRFSFSPSLKIDDDGDEDIHTTQARSSLSSSSFTTHSFTFSLLHFLIVLSKFSRCCVVRSFRTLTRSDPLFLLSLSSSKEIPPLSLPQRKFLLSLPSPFFRISFPRSSLHFLSNQTEKLWHTLDLFFPLSLSLSSLRCHQEKSYYQVYLHPTPPFILVNLGERTLTTCFHFS